MLVTDPKQRASLNEIINHPWMTKGFSGPPENHLPQREALQLPLDSDVVQRMTGFDFGSPEFITNQLTKVIESDDYQNAVRASLKETPAPNPHSEKKRGVFDFYKRRNSNSKDTLSSPSFEVVNALGDPTNAYNPLISIYYLVREKQRREQQESRPGALTIPHTSGEPPLKLPEIPAPETAHTGQNAYEVPGEREAGGRTRPRARTHGDDELTEGMKKVNLAQAAAPASPTIVTPPIEHTPKKESAAVGLLRRFSTRKTRDRGREVEREKFAAPRPSLNVQPPEDITPPRKSFSVRRPRRGDVSPGLLHSDGSRSQNQDLLRTPRSDEPSRLNSVLGRSTSVNSADYRSRRNARRGLSDATGAVSHQEPPLTSGSDRSTLSVQKARGTDSSNQDPKGTPRNQALRTKSLGHARRESIQARRARREETREADVPEETDAELNGEGTALENANSGEDLSKPVYLKGLFSVSTTSSKPLPFIRADIIRVLNQLAVEWAEIKGGFSCRHAPSIDLNRVVDARPSSPERQGMVGGHRRRISLGGMRAYERDESKDEGRPSHSSRTPRRNHGPPDQSFVTNSDGSEEYVTPRGERVVGETTTRVQSDTGENLVLKFEILIVKVPLFSLHGIQFKKVSGGMWQYREMAKKILDALRL